MLTYWFDLGQEIKIEGRQVTSFPVLFGDISGLKDFFNFFIVLVIGSFQSNAFKFDMLKTFFRYDMGNKMKVKLTGLPDDSLAKQRMQFAELDLSLIQKFKLSLCNFFL